MKKSFLLLVVFCLLASFSSVAYASNVRGVVAYYNYSSDKIIIETSMGFTCGEIYGYAGTLSEGDTVVGELESYGFHDIYDISHDRSIRIYIDEYWLNAERALEWLGR